LYNVTYTVHVQTDIPSNIASGTLKKHSATVRFVQKHRTVHVNLSIPTSRENQYANGKVMMMFQELIHLENISILGYLILIERRKEIISLD
jgi:hypothetical protein